MVTDLPERERESAGGCSCFGRQTHLWKTLCQPTELTLALARLVICFLISSITTEELQSPLKAVMSSHQSRFAILTAFFMLKSFSSHRTLVSRKESCSYAACVIIPFPSVRRMLPQ